MVSGKTKKSLPNAAKGGPAAGAPVAETSALPEADVLYLQFRALWPSCFCAPRRAVFLLAALAMLGILLFGTAALGGFTAVKMSLAAQLGLSAPEQVYGGNYDFACVVMGLAAVAFLSMIHPGLGIGLIVLGRSWLDGYTFPLDNVYFTWSIYLLSAWWLARVVRSRDRIETPVPVFLFAALIIYLFATARFSCQYGATYSMLWLWTGYAALFLASLNLARDRVVHKFLMFLFLLAMGLQAIFSILHFEFLLPYLRMIIQNPAVLRHYFNSEVITPELARRFMVNRAFGTMLFPNTLAGYLVMGIPVTVALCFPFWRSFRLALRPVRRIPRGLPGVRDRILLTMLSAGMGMLVFVAIVLIAYFPREYRDASAPMPAYLSMYFIAPVAFLAACGAAMAMYALLQRYGLEQGWILIRFPVTITLAVLLAYTLWITYSRGAFLGLFFASVFSFVLYKSTPASLARVISLFRGRSVAVLGILVSAVFGMALLGTHAATTGSGWAQDSQDKPVKAAADTAKKLPAPSRDPRTQVKSEGLTLTTSDLVDPASFRLRLGYWRVAARMALDNWKWGVGLGNFAIAYPIYQYVGAGDVREAHNGYLQFFSETGLLGGLIFLAFWLYFGIWGAWRVLNEADPAEKRLLAGMYAGMAAFCAHAFLDINFSHPSLMMFAMVFCGLFYARACRQGCLPEEGDKSRPPSTISMGQRAAALILLLFLGAAWWAGLQVYLQQIALNRLRFVNLSWDDEMQRRVRSGQFYLIEVPAYARARERGEEIKNAPRLPLSSAQFLLNDMNVLTTGYTFYGPQLDTPGRFVKLEPGAPVPENALVAVRKPWFLFHKAVPAGEAWIEELKFQDRRFPHSTELAMHIAKWYEIYARHVHEPRYANLRDEWIDQYLRWSEILVSRNPRHPDMHMFLGNTLLWLAVWGGRKDSNALADRAISEYEQMVRLSPISPSHRRIYSQASKEIGEYYKKMGDEAAATRCMERSDALKKEANDLEARRQQARLYS